MDYHRNRLKAPGWDLLNQSLLTSKSPLMNQFLYNCVLECIEKNKIPKILSCSRLIPFNKTPGKIPSVNEIRNIST